MKKNNKKILIRAGMILVALVIVGTGFVPLFTNKELFYLNWWGGLVFAPITIIAGAFFLYLILFKWDKIEKMM
jgi:hypothetical protein